MNTEATIVRTGQGSTKLSRPEFEHRYRAQFIDPAFNAATEEVERLTAIAWEAYEDGRKSPHTRKAGPEFADPEHELSVEWLETRAATAREMRVPMTVLNDRLVEDALNRITVRRTPVFEGVEILQEKQPGGLLGVVELAGATGVFPEDVIDVFEGLLEHRADRISRRVLPKWIAAASRYP